MSQFELRISIFNKFRFFWQLLGVVAATASASRVSPWANNLGRLRREIVNLHDGEFCVDVSTYGLVKFTETPREKCDTTFQKQCEDRNEQVKSTFFSSYFCLFQASCKATFQCVLLPSLFTSNLSAKLRFYLHVLPVMYSVPRYLETKIVITKPTKIAVLETKIVEKTNCWSPKFQFCCCRFATKWLKFSVKLCPTPNAPCPWSPRHTRATKWSPKSLWRRSVRRVWTLSNIPKWCPNVATWPNRTASPNGRRMPKETRPVIIFLLFNSRLNRTTQILMNGRRESCAANFIILIDDSRIL